MQGKKKGKAVKRLDLSAMKEALRDTRCWACLGIVKSDDNGDYYELTGDDVLVDVELQPQGTQITARLGTVGGSFGAGVWCIPPIGAEVLVVMPEGDMAFAPIIVGLYSSGDVPSGLAINTIVVACPPGGKVLIHDGAGGTDELVKKSAYEVHKHPTGTGPSGDPDNALSASSYTSVLEAK
jgi:hypothetical protein